MKGRVTKPIWVHMRAWSRSPGVRRAAGLVLRFVVGWILSQARVFDHYAPFGVGYVAAVGTGASGLFGLMGTLTGYLFLWEVSDGLKYIAISVLVFAAGVIFRETKSARRSLFLSLVTVASGLFVGVVFLAGESFDWQKVLLLAVELILMSGSGYFFRIAMERKPVREAEPPDTSTKRLVSVLILTACLLLSLTGVTLFGRLSLARLLSSMLILLFAYQNGIAGGSAAGLSLGMALDLSGGTPFFSMAYGAPGLLAGIFAPAGRFLCACAYVVTGAVAVLWTSDEALRFNMLIETFIVSVVFMILPDSLMRRLPFAPEPQEELLPRVKRGREIMEKRLEASALVMKDIYDELVTTYDTPPRRPEEDVALVFDRMADRVCHKCVLLGACWDREAKITLEALTEVTARMLEKGSVEPNDFPVSFSGRCLNYQRLVGVVNEELTAMTYRKQFGARLRESRLLVCQQYAEVAKMLHRLAYEFEETPIYEHEKEIQLDKLFKTMAIQGKPMVFRDRRHRLHVEIEGENLEALREETGHLSKLLGVPLGEARREALTHGERLIFLETPPYFPSLGLAAMKKKGQSVSGDSVSYVKTDDGKLYLMLSDGMGSGELAARDSKLALKILERFLAAGISPETALKTLNSTLLLKGEDPMGFITMDLLMFDMMTGQACFYKFGAAPSYIKSGRRISRITTSSLPVGLDAGGLGKPLDITRMAVGYGQIVVLASDGVADVEEDGWLTAVMNDWGAGSPKEMAEQIIRQAAQKNGGGDDMTVMVLRVEKGKERASLAIEEEGHGVS